MHCKDIVFTGDQQPHSFFQYASLVHVVENSDHYLNGGCWVK